jgi:hypothetical protein
MEPVQQLIKKMRASDFKPSFQTSDSQESFLAYLGQSRAPRVKGAKIENREATEVSLSPLARLAGKLSPEGRQALINLIEFRPNDDQPYREQLGHLLETLIADENSGEEIESRLNGLQDLFTRIINSADESQGPRNLLVSIRELNDLPGQGKKFFFETLDDFLKLTDRNLGGIAEDLTGMDPAERDSFIRVLGELLQRGVVGTETLKNRDDGTEQETFITTRLGSTETRREENEPQEHRRKSLDPTERRLEEK